MKIFKKLIAVVLVCLMVFSLTGCHKKGEIAVTINGYEFTSAYYMCALINSYMEAQQLVYADLTDEELKATSIDYFSKKIEGKKFEQWVKDDAIETLKETAYYKTVCDEAKLKISDEDKATNESYASMYWASYGYAQMFEPNGVSQATFTQYMSDSYYAELYFGHLYGKDGEKEISAKTVKNKLYDDFLIADILEFTKGEETTSELDKISKKFKDYAKKLESGDMTFEEVYNDYNDVKETDKKEEEVIEEVKQLQRGEWKSLADDTYYIKRNLVIGCGKLKLFVGYSPSEQAIQDVYITKCGSGGCEKNLQCIAILMSALLRTGASLEMIEKAFSGVSACPSFTRERGKGKHLSDGSYCGMAILKEMKLVLKQLNKDVEVPKQERIVETKEEQPKGSICPECKQPSLVRTNGCNACTNCGYSKCD